MNDTNTKPQLRFMTCGSVDDGKSTLIGRLLFDCGEIYDDQIQSLINDSKTFGTTGENIDFALLLDGLSVEREQGITIDVAYRYFRTTKRDFVVADTPGHEQYTRNMVTAASNCEAAIILIDARKGISVQTSRHAYIVNMMGIKNVYIAVNKMDLVEYSQTTFENIKNEFQKYAKEIKLERYEILPICAISGENLNLKSKNMTWFSGPTLIELLENTDNFETEQSNLGFCMPVQYVNRPNLDFRGFCGNVIRGEIAIGDEICILPSGQITTVSKILIGDDNVDIASKNDAITLCFNDEIDCSRGDVITASSKRMQISDQFSARIVWMSEQALIPRRNMIMRIGTQSVSANIEPPDFKIDFTNLGQLATKTLYVNDIGVVKLSTDRPIVYAPFSECTKLGSFILIDKLTNQTVAAGLINFALRRAQNIHWQLSEIGRNEHAIQKSQKAAIIWLTGLSGSGKSTIANALERQLFEMGFHSYILDGDNVRHGLCRDLGFTQTDRVENIRRVAHVARLMSDAGLIVICAFISPFGAERELARTIAQTDEFIEVYVKTPLEVAENRDPKGLYKRARSGEIKNFTGIDSPYEAPYAPELTLDTTKVSAKECANNIIEYLQEKNFIKSS